MRETIGLVVATVLVAMLGLLPRAVSAGGAIHAGVPSGVDPTARFLFYLSGRAVEVQGPKAKTPWGEYRYTDILAALADRGFVVISEVRPPTTDILAYARTVAGQVARLIAAGVPAGHVTVAGFSKGGAIAVLATATIGNPEVKFVLMGACLRPGGGRTPVDLAAAGQPRGRVLSLYDAGDTEATPCASVFANTAGVTFTETLLNEGRGHGLFITPEARWLDLVAEWARS